MEPDLRDMERGELIDYVIDRETKLEDARRKENERADKWRNKYSRKVMENEKLKFELEQALNLVRKTEAAV